MIRGHIFGRHAHMIIIKNIPQTIHNHGIGHVPGAHFNTIPQVHSMWRQTHIFLATRHHNPRIASHNGLGGQHHTPEARTTNLIQRQRGFLGGNARQHGRLPRRILPLAAC